VLERHLKREEVILPKREVGRFKGEAVYRRSSVVSCKTPENWMRIGRIVKAGQEPLKWVKQRAVTLDRRRAQELANLEGKEPIQQGLYAEWQTQIFTPPPIENVRAWDLDRHVFLYSNHTRD
jgi:xeroderma pigmentosum group C-complementing protein